MGFSYSVDPMDGKMKLDCDICGTPGARKYKCPFGYCQAIAACKKCRKEKPEYFSKGYHRKQGCEEFHKKFVEQQNREKELLEQGNYVRCSALGAEEGLVHVLFRNKVGEYIGYKMEVEVYHALPIGEPMVPADYLKFGKLFAAAPDFENGRTTKRLDGGIQ